MFTRFLIVTLCACILGAAAPEPGLAGPDSSPEIMIPEPELMMLCRVVRVVDGDTILVDLAGTPTRFELLAINAPEYIERDPTPRAHAREAWFALWALLEGEWVYLHRDPAVLEDAAGRMTGFVFRVPDMMLVNQEMVRQGHAEHRPARSELFAEALAWWQRHAIEAEKGLWSDEPVLLVTPAAEPAVEPAPFEFVPQMITPAPEERTVFLTRSGSKYHTEDCRYYSPSCTEVPISEARKEHQPCKVCKPDGDGG